MRSDVLEMIGELVAGVPRLQFVVDAIETHVRPVIPLAQSESDSLTEMSTRNISWGIKAAVA